MSDRFTAGTMEQSLGANMLSMSTEVPETQSEETSRENLDKVEDNKTSVITFMNTFQSVDKRDVADSAVTSDHIRDQADDTVLVSSHSADSKNQFVKLCYFEFKVYFFGSFSDSTKFSI